MWACLWMAPVMPLSVRDLPPPNTCFFGPQTKDKFSVSEGEEHHVNNEDEDFVNALLSMKPDHQHLRYPDNTLLPPQVYSKNGTWIRLSVLAQLTVVYNRQTHRLADKPCYICNNRLRTRGLAFFRKIGECYELLKLIKFAFSIYVCNGRLS